MKRNPVRRRLDHLLVERGITDSLQKAAAMVLAGEVLVDGKRQEKAGSQVTLDAQIEVVSRRRYASRAGFKLEGALEDFSIDPAGRICLDVGSSHGGFTDCLLQHGAVRVYAVDVNIEQLAWKLCQDRRVIRIERNARELRASEIPELADVVVIDVSFISVCKVIGPVSSVAKPGAVFLILVKPQFELPREKVGLGGVEKHGRLESAPTSTKLQQLAKAAGLRG